MLTHAYPHKTRTYGFTAFITLAGALFAMGYTQAGSLDTKVIDEAAGMQASIQRDGVVRIEWSRDDVPVTVDGMQLPPSAGLGSWAAFKAVPGGVMVMGDTVAFEDENHASHGCRLCQWPECDRFA
jgi:hypothetical protein